MHSGITGRAELEKREYEILSPFAAKSAESRGRDFEEEKCDVRTEYLSLIHILQGAHTKRDARRVSAGSEEAAYNGCGGGFWVVEHGRSREVQTLSLIHI